MDWGWKTTYGSKTHYVPESDDSQTHTLCGLHTSLEWLGDPDEVDWPMKCKKCKKKLEKIRSGSIDPSDLGWKHVL